MFSNDNVLLEKYILHLHASLNSHWRYTIKPSSRKFTSAMETFATFQLRHTHLQTDLVFLKSSSTFLWMGSTVPWAPFLTLSKKTLHCSSLKTARSDVYPRSNVARYSFLCTWHCINLIKPKLFSTSSWNALSVMSYVIASIPFEAMYL